MNASEAFESLPAAGFEVACGVVISQFATIGSDASSRRPKPKGRNGHGSVNHHVGLWVHPVVDGEYVGRSVLGPDVGIAQGAAVTFDTEGVAEETFPSVKFPSTIRRPSSSYRSAVEF